MRALTYVLGLVLCLAVQPALAQKPVVIGFSLPLTGEHAQYGEVFKNASSLALELFNKAGGVEGAKVEIKYEDSKSDPKEAVNIAQKFIDDKTLVAALGDFSSTVAMAQARLYADAKLPQLSPTASHPDFAKISPYQFRNITTQAFEGPFMVDWVSTLGFTNVAIVAVQNDWGLSAAENFKAAMEKKGGKAPIEYFNPGTRDFKAIITKISRAAPQAVYLCMMYEEAASFMQQYRQLDMKLPAFGTSSLYAPKLLELGGPAVEGLRISSTFVPDSPDAHVAEFVKLYKERFGAAPNQFAGQAFDATGIVLAAVKKAGPSATRQAVRDAIAATTDYPGVTGKTSFDPQTREPSKSMVKMEISGGAFKVVN